MGRSGNLGIAWAVAGAVVLTTVLVVLGLLLAVQDEDHGATIQVPGRDDGAVKTAATRRADRRAYDGAPPVIPHRNFRMECVSCHNEQGMSVPDVGFAPPMPHELTRGLSAMSRCTQCHVFQETDAVFVDNTFQGLRQDLRPGDRWSGTSPPRIPHSVFMRENCLACHSGPAAREEIRSSHPERARCLQCHVEQTTDDLFARP